MVERLEVSIESKLDPDGRLGEEIQRTIESSPDPWAWADRIIDRINELSNSELRERLEDRFTTLFYSYMKGFENTPNENPFPENPLSLSNPKDKNERDGKKQKRKQEGLAQLLKVERIIYEAKRDYWQRSLQSKKHGRKKHR